MTLRVSDGHNDARSRLAQAGPAAAAGFLAGDGQGHVDLPRAGRGGLAGGCFAVFGAVGAALGDITGLPALFGALLEAGFAQAELELVAHRNWRRVLEATWTA